MNMCDWLYDEVLGRARAGEAADFLSLEKWVMTALYDAIEGWAELLAPAKYSEVVICSVAPRVRS